MAPTEARRILGEVTKGNDPAGQKQETRKAATVAELCDAYIEAARAGRVLTRRKTAKKAGSLAIDCGRVERHVKLLLGRLKVTAVSKVSAPLQSTSEVAAAKRQPTCNMAPINEDLARAGGAARPGQIS